MNFLNKMVKNTKTNTENIFKNIFCILDGFDFSS